MPPRTRRDSSSDSSSDREGRSSCRTCRFRRCPSFSSSSDRGKDGGRRGRGRGRGRPGPRQEGSHSRSRSRSCGLHTTEREGSRRSDQNPEPDHDSHMEPHGSADRVSPTGPLHGSERESVSSCDSDSSDSDGSSSSSDYGSDTGSNTGRPQDMDEVSLNMAVLARRSHFTWERGKICKIVLKGNGKRKFRVAYEGEGSVALHGHQIAFDEAPILQQLYIGARVVAKYPDNQAPFRPGVLAELPTIKNKKRFLVFFDDHTPAYLSLPLLRLVCRPLKNVWEDIPDSAPRTFIEEYLKFWPNEPLGNCKVGDVTYLDVNGIQRSCEVQQVEYSLVQVAFQDEPQHKEWIYRGAYISRLRFMKKNDAKGKQRDKPASRPTVTGPPSDLPEDEVTLNMPVLAKKGPLIWKHWQPGKICKIVTKDNGKIKYKIDFEDKGRSLNSGHHIAFNKVANGRERLYIGARVVAKYDEARFYPGILAELPTRQNKMRFLVFFDNGTSNYVNLPHLRLVCRPLKNVWEDIPDSSHREFIEECLRTWPDDPPQCRINVGQMISVEFNGVQKICEVQQVNCSLIEVAFQDDQHKEWIYRGSHRLDPVKRQREEAREKEDKKDKKDNHKKPRTNRRRPSGRRLVSR